jgi:REP-associated tyrosine transposase
MQLIKAGSSKWMHDEMRRLSFAWQENYSAFTLGVSQVPRTIRYIENQREHHKHQDCRQELSAFLQRHGIVPED